MTDRTHPDSGRITTSSDVIAGLHDEIARLERELSHALQAADVEARELFDAGWKAAARFCDREDVVADGIIGGSGCPQFEQAYEAARAQQEKK